MSTFKGHSEIHLCHQSRNKWAAYSGRLSRSESVARSPKRTSAQCPTWGDFKSLAKVNISPNQDKTSSRYLIKAKAPSLACIKAFTSCPDRDMTRSPEYIESTICAACWVCALLQSECSSVMTLTKALPNFLKPLWTSARVWSSMSARSAEALHKNNPCSFHHWKRF